MSRENTWWMFFALVEFFDAATWAMLQVFSKYINIQAVFLCQIG